MIDLSDLMCSPDPLPPPPRFDFTRQLAESRKHHDLVSAFAREWGEPLTPGSDAQDRAGGDYIDASGRWIDFKFRPAGEYLALSKKDDLALETWSSIGGKVGWTRDPDKQTDFAVWIWPSTRRVVVCRYRPLRAWYTRNWVQLRKQCQTAQQPNLGWTSECTMVPVARLHAAGITLARGYLSE